MINKITLYIVLLSTLACTEQNYSVKTAHQEDDTYGDVVMVVTNWDQAHKEGQIDKFQFLYHDTVSFYNTILPLKECLKKKKSLLTKYPDFTQTSSDFHIYSKDSNSIMVEFNKSVWYNGITKVFPSYLFMQNINGTWKIVNESDLITDKNLKTDAFIIKKANYDNPIKPIVKKKTNPIATSKDKNKEPVTENNLQSQNYLAGTWRGSSSNDAVASELIIKTNATCVFSEFSNGRKRFQSDGKIYINIVDQRNAYGENTGRQVTFIKVILDKPYLFTDGIFYRVGSNQNKLFFIDLNGEGITMDNLDKMKI